MSSKAIEGIRKLRYVVVKTMPILDAIEAGVDLVQDPSLKRIKRAVTTFRRLSK